jgi:hypothetical protein
MELGYVKTFKFFKVRAYHTHAQDILVIVSIGRAGTGFREVDTMHPLFVPCRSRQG